MLLSSSLHTPFFENDAIVLGILITILAAIFYTASSENKSWQKFYLFVPALLLCYFIPALFNWPLGLISPHWYDASLLDALAERGLTLPEGLSFDAVKNYLIDNGFTASELSTFERHSELYYMASRYLLPASLILLCLSIDLKGVLNLGPKALIMFFAATLGIIIGGPIALLVANAILPDLSSGTDTELWRGLSTIAGSWIGGGANQTAMKEIFEVPDSLFGTMIVVDVIVANIWMGFLLYGANITDRIDAWLKADNSAIKDLRDRVADYRASIRRVPDITSLFLMLAVAFGGVGLSHWGAQIMTGIMSRYKDALMEYNLTSLTSGFFWLIVFATTFGLILSFTRVRKLEGVGASTWGSIFIYILVATIGMKMNIGEVLSNLQLFTVGIIWMLVHVTVLLITAKIIRAPFFFVAVGSQANVGGAASAPIVASAFDSALAPVGVLMAVLGYALGTYGALICAQLMSLI